MKSIVFSSSCLFVALAVGWLQGSHGLSFRPHRKADAEGTSKRLVATPATCDQSVWNAGVEVEAEAG
eukprot:CAMPEP_0171093328 /NCGR_PEP_ID=MMETSP0766_2-20121228/39018_1 /TAXON_ID=439317 /ORGANISM="Gambierdiscus australes, Strain CAWD 149" /LENGTH=66 /DNA_ID=CAMNT_0011551759 /DNA_START=15 /DNA_END=212 /DNA_ORIENTATION=+